MYGMLRNLEDGATTTLLSRRRGHDKRQSVKSTALKRSIHNGKKTLHVDARTLQIRMVMAAMQERRNTIRFKTVPFEFYVPAGDTLRIDAVDASAESALFRRSDWKSVGTPVHVRVTLDGRELQVRNIRARFDPSRGDHVTVVYTTEDITAAELTEPEASYALSELDRMWDRYRHLQAKNRDSAGIVVKLYTMLFVFAAAPFTLQQFVSTGMARIWGFGGLWLAITIWFFCDRAFRAHGLFWFEKIHCLRQIDQIRKLFVGRSTLYNSHSLYRRLTDSDNSRNRVTGATHISRSQVLYTVYFYKVVSLFQPMYLILFIALVLFPREIIEPNQEISRAVYFRVMLGFSFVLFVWLHTNMNRCCGLLRNAFRARRISPENPWPKYPEDEVATPGAKWARIVFLVTAAVTSVVNFVRFASLYRDGASSLDNWWADLDRHLLGYTAALLIIYYAYHEFAVRNELGRASKIFPLPKALFPN